MISRRSALSLSRGMANYNIYTGAIPSNMVENLLHLADKYGLGCLQFRIQHFTYRWPLLKFNGSHVWGQVGADWQSLSHPGYETEMRNCNISSPNGP